jgi:hypothetical protein
MPEKRPEDNKSVYPGCSHAQAPVGNVLRDKRMITKATNASREGLRADSLYEQLRQTLKKNKMVQGRDNPDLAREAMLFAASLTLVPLVAMAVAGTTVFLFAANILSAGIAAAFLRRCFRVNHFSHSPFAIAKPEPPATINAGISNGKPHGMVVLTVVTTAGDASSSRVSCAKAYRLLW